MNGTARTDLQARVSAPQVGGNSGKVERQVSGDLFVVLCFFYVPVSYRLNVT